MTKDNRTQYCVKRHGNYISSRFNQENPTFEKLDLFCDKISKELKQMGFNVPSKIIKKSLPSLDLVSHKQEIVLYVIDLYEDKKPDHGMKTYFDEYASKKTKGELTKHQVGEIRRQYENSKSIISNVLSIVLDHIECAANCLELEDEDRAMSHLNRAAAYIESKVRT